MIPPRLAASCMPVPVVDIGEVRMGVGDRLVSMLVAVRLGRVDPFGMAVAVVLVVDVHVGVQDLFMAMLVDVPFGEVEPYTDPHKRRCPEEQRSDGLPQEGERDDCADEWGEGEVGSRSGGTDRPQGKDEEHQAEPVAEEADDESGP